MSFLLFYILTELVKNTMKCLLVILIAIEWILQICIGADCEYKDAPSGRFLDLDALAHTTIEYEHEDNGNVYTYTPCKNAAGECPNGGGGGGTNTGMSVQTNKNNEAICYILANMDADITPTYNDEGNGTWTFIFANGDPGGNCTTNRILGIILFCNPQGSDYKVLGVGMYVCIYFCTQNRNNII